MCNLTSMSHLRFIEWPRLMKKRCLLKSPPWVQTLSAKCNTQAKVCTGYGGKLCLATVNLSPDLAFSFYINRLPNDLYFKICSNCAWYVANCGFRYFHMEICKSADIFLYISEYFFTFDESPSNSFFFQQTNDVNTNDLYFKICSNCARYVANCAHQAAVITKCKKL